jgi:hypothetical protein
MTVMSHMVEQLMQNFDPEFSPRVPREQYDQWARGFVFDGLRNQRYGQSFCNRFGIQDNLLFFAESVEEADRYIQKNYIK